MAKYLDYTGLQQVWTAIGSKFVAKNGTDRLMTEAEGEKLASIAASAQTNVIETVKVNGTALTPDANKAVNVVVPAATVTGVKSGEKVISLDGTELQSTLKLNIKPTGGTEYLQVLGISDEVVAEVDASTFVKDGMIDEVFWGTGSTAGDSNKLYIVWNTDAGKQTTAIDFAKFIDTYTSGKGINVDGQQINVKLAGTQGNVVLGFASDSGLTASIDLGNYATTADTKAISDELAAHTADTTVHITAAERTAWQGATDKVTASAGTWNTTANNLTAMAVFFNQNFCFFPDLCG